MPTDTARPGRLTSYRRLFGYAAPYRSGWAAIVAATLATTALSLVQPWPLKVLVDHVLGGRPLQGWAGECAGAPARHRDAAAACSRGWSRPGSSSSP